MGANAHPRLQWSDVPFLLALGREKTLSAAARHLGVDRTTVARRIDALEAGMGQALFDRIEGVYELSQQGRKAFSAAELAEQGIAEFVGNLGARRHIRGKIRLTYPTQFSIALVDLFIKFEQNYPDIHLELVATDRQVDLDRYEADVALRLSRKQPADLHCLKLGSTPLRLYCASSSNSDFTRFLSPPGNRTIPPEVLKHAPDTEIVMSIDGFLPLREYIARGVGIGTLPCWLGDPDPRLVGISPELFNNEWQLWAVCLPEQRHLDRIKIFLNFLRKEMPISGIIELSETRDYQFHK